MNISFSTICPGYAKQYLWGEHYAYFNEKAKNYIMENLGDLRVQDPMMYPSPQIEISGPRAQEHYDKLMALACEKEEA